MVCMILLWLGVGNVLSIVLPTGTNRSGNASNPAASNSSSSRSWSPTPSATWSTRCSIWRVFAARELTERLGNAIIPAILIVLSSAFMWILLTVFAVALSQQPKIRRVMQKEITDYKANAEMKAYQEEAAAAANKQAQTVNAAPGNN